MISINETYRHLDRLKEIVRILFKYHLEEYLEEVRLPGPVRGAVHQWVRQRNRDIGKKPRGERIRLALEEIGPTYIKLGQLLSTRSDLLPRDILTELSKLQDEVPPFPFKEVREILSAEFKEEDFGRLYEQFDPRPVGSASLAQVHRAVLNGGREAAVKVQRPGIKKKIAEDVEIMRYLARFLEKHYEEKMHPKPARIVEEFAESLKRELNYKLEEANIRRFQQMFGSDPDIYIMEVFPEHTTSRVLTMELLKGTSVRQLLKEDHPDIDKRRVAELCVHCMLKQIFEEGFFHADPHPGNILILQNGVISLIDLGMVGRLNHRSRELTADILEAVYKHDEQKVVKLLLEISEYERKPDENLLERQMAELIDLYVNKPLKEVSLGRFFTDLNHMLACHRISLPADFSLVIKAFSNLEGLGRELHPEINLIQEITPYVRRLKIERLYPQHILMDALDSAGDILRLLKDLPERIEAVLDQVRSGKAKLDVVHTPGEPFRVLLNRLSNRLAFSIILAAMLVGSSIMVHSGIPPRWNDIPMIGLAGFLIAGLMSCYLLISIWKNNEF